MYTVYICIRTTCMRGVSLIMQESLLTKIKLLVLIYWKLLGYILVYEKHVDLQEWRQGSLLLSLRVWIYYFTLWKVITNTPGVKLSNSCWMMSWCCLVVCSLLWNPIHFNMSSAHVFLKIMYLYFGNSDINYKAYFVAVTPGKSLSI